MSDIYLSLALHFGFAACLFFGTRRAAARFARSTCDIAAISVVSVMVLYIVYVWDQVWLVHWLPYSSLIVLGNWFPELTAVLAGFVFRRTEGQPLRRALDVGVLFSAGLLSTVSPLLGSAPACGDVWFRDRVCLQTTNRTCTPACAATLLRAYGIPATEQEMADLCLTRRGTTWQGLYHGLKRKTADTDWDVVVTQGRVSDLLKLGGKPVILRVGMDSKSDTSEEFAKEMGWRPGVGHSVVFLRFIDANTIEVADPTPDIGIERWTLYDLRESWDGQMVGLVPRNR